MAVVKEKDRVRIVRREATDEDIKSCNYFAFMGGLTGIVSKVYDVAQVAVEIEQESLTAEIRKRHQEIRDQMKTKWLDGLSEEGKSKLTDREKDFNLRYMVLVSMDDLEPISADAPSGDRAVRATAAELEAAEAAELLRRAKPTA